MSRRNRIVLVGLLAVAALILTMPLSMALALFVPKGAGLTARSVSGTIWSGRLTEARIAGLALGDTTVGLRALPLLRGDAQLAFAAPQLKGVLRAAPVGYGIARTTGSLLTAGRLAPLPVAQIELEDANVRFGSGGCEHAEGRARIALPGDLGGLRLPGGLAGAIRCDGPALLLPLRGQSGLEHLDLRITANGRWRAELAIKPGDPALAVGLIAAGFAPGPRGLTLRLAGAL